MTSGTSTANAQHTVISATLNGVNVTGRLRDCTYVAIDGGMSDNLRPLTYGARYETFLPDRARAERPLTASVAGKHCEQGDVIVTDARLPGDVAVGDILATPVTGSYCHSMASNYNKVTRPAVVFVRDGKARLVVRRESQEDLVRLDIEP
jgi:diaminopimelate decarboxylase